MKASVLVALLGVLLLPVSAGAATSIPIGPSGEPYHLYHLDLRPIERPFLTPQPTGDVELDFGKSGIVSGYFRANDSGTFVLVTGGVDGSRIWLDIGSNATVDHFDGELQLDRITGTGRFAGGDYYFRLLPEKQLGV